MSGRDGSSVDGTGTDAGVVARRTVDGEVIEWLASPRRALELDLQPHPEGGWYRRTWASPAGTQTDAGPRPAATLILFLLPPGEFSAWHVVTSDEIWLWHGPGDVELQLGGTGDEPAPGEILTLGAAHAPQGLVPAGTWQRTIPRSEEALVSCVVSPGFSFADWRLEA